MTAYEMRTSDWSSDVCSSDLNCPESSWRSSDDRDRLGREDARNVSRRPRSTINRVLEHAGNTVVVFRGRKQQPIGLGNCFLQVSHGLRYSLFFLDIGVIARDALIDALVSLAPSGMLEMGSESCRERE